MARSHKAVGTGKVAATHELDSGSIVVVIESGVPGSRRRYNVKKDVFGEFTCTCPDHVYRERQCKHIAVAKGVIQATPKGEF